MGKDYCTIIDFIGNFQNAYKIVEHLELGAARRGTVALLKQFQIDLQKKS